MAYTKTKIYNLALSILLLSREVSDVLTDETNEVRILNTHWDIALESTLQDLDLDSTSQPITLELIETLSNHIWQYSYKYPTNCAFLRRIESPCLTDTKSSHIAKRISIRNGVKVIFTDEALAVGECIPKDVPIESLNSMAVMTVAHRLAELSAPLLVGKGAKALREDIRNGYVAAKLEAQETDARENFNYESDAQRSEWVEERIS